MKRPAIRILIVDDHEVVRKGLCALLKLERDLHVVGEAETAAAAVAQVERLHPDIVLLDVRLPDNPEMEACKRLLSASPQSRILILTSYAEDTTVVAAVQSGAHGYLLKDARANELIRAIRTVAEGSGYLDPGVAQGALHWIRNRSQSTPLRELGHLSAQERVILPLLASGKTNKEIAAHLNLSDKTIKNYIAHIFDKLRVKRRTEAVAWYVHATRSKPLDRIT